MTKKEHAARLRADTTVHYNCAQAVLVPYAREARLTEEQACAIALDFRRGMGCGAMCGAVTGAMMVLGALGQPQEKRLELLRYFRGETGAVNCAELLRAAMERGEEQKAHCDAMVAICMDYLADTTGKE